MLIICETRYIQSYRGNGPQGAEKTVPGKFGKLQPVLIDCGSQAIMSSRGETAAPNDPPWDGVPARSRHRRRYYSRLSYRKGSEKERLRYPIAFMGGLRCLLGNDVYSFDLKNQQPRFRRLLLRTLQPKRDNLFRLAAPGGGMEIPSI